MGCKRKHCRSGIRLRPSVLLWGVWYKKRNKLGNRKQVKRVYSWSRCLEPTNLSCKHLSGESPRSSSRSPNRSPFFRTNSKLVDTRPTYWFYNHCNRPITKFARAEIMDSSTFKLCRVYHRMLLFLWKCAVEK